MANGDKDDPSKKASAGADKMVPGVPGQTSRSEVPTRRPLRSSNPHIESLKRVILSNPQVQESLAGAANQQNFVEQLAALSVQHNVPVSVGEVLAHMEDMARHASDSEDDIPSPSPGPSPGGCGSPNTATSAYSLNCGFSTQTCLCTN